MKTTSKEEAIKIIQADKQNREEECAKEVSKVLQKHNCEIRLGGISIFALEDKTK